MNMETWGDGIFSEDFCLGLGFERDGLGFLKCFLRILLQGPNWCAIKII